MTQFLKLLCLLEIVWVCDYRIGANGYYSNPPPPMVCVSFIPSNLWRMPKLSVFCVAKYSEKILALHATMSISIFL